MGIKGKCSTREQVGVVQSSPPMRITVAVIKAAVIMCVVLLFPTLALVSKGLVAQAADGALDWEEKVAPPQLQNRGHTIRLFGSTSLFADNEGEEITKASLLVDTSKCVCARRLNAVSNGDCKAVAVAAILRRMGPSHDPARVRKPLTVRPIKLFILCANRSLRKANKKKVGIRVIALTSPSRPVPANGNHHRRALTQLPQLQGPPLPFTLPSVPPLSFSPPLSPQLQIPPQPLPRPLVPPPRVALTSPSRLVPANQHKHRRALKQLLQLQVPPLPFRLPLVPPLLFTPPSPQFQIPPLPFTLPSVPPLPFTPPSPRLQIAPLPVTFPIPSVPSPSGKSLPPP